LRHHFWGGEYASIGIPIYSAAMTSGKSELRAPPELATGILGAFIRHQAALKRFIGRFIHNSADVDEIAQEAFLRAFSVEKGRAIDQPKSFLFRIAKHAALSRLTHKANRITSYIEDSEESEVIQLESSAEDEVSARQILGLHCEAVATLPPQCRQAYILRKVHGMSHKEIAVQLGIAVSTVEKHLMKGIEECDRYVLERTYPVQDSDRVHGLARKRGDGS
jgi:RNA polymerase sigma-70 factor (ECF subfamily)